MPIHVTMQELSHQNNIILGAISYAQTGTPTWGGLVAKHRFPLMIQMWCNHVQVTPYILGCCSLMCSVCRVPYVQCDDMLIHYQYHRFIAFYSSWGGRNPQCYFTHNHNVMNEGIMTSRWSQRDKLTLAKAPCNWPLHSKSSEIWVATFTCW